MTSSGAPRYSNLVGDDDFLVADVPTVPLWNETMACLLDDPVSGVTSNFYIGRWWGKPTMLRQMITFQLPGNRALFARNYGVASPLGAPPSAAGLTMEPLGDSSAIHYTYDGPMDLRKSTDASREGVGTGPTVRAELDFTFSSKLPIWDMHAGGSQGREEDLMFPGGHMEQLGSASGTPKFSGETIIVKDGPTIRDHSRGVRDFSRHDTHIWCNGQFPSGFGFHCFKASVLGQPGYPMNMGSIIKDGKIVPASLEIERMLAPGTDIWEPFDFVLKPAGMAAIRIQVTKLWNLYQIGMYEPADVYWGVPTRREPGALWSIEQSTEFRMDGEVGYGHVERCNRAIVVDDFWRKMCAADHFGYK